VGEREETRGRDGEMPHPSTEDRNARILLWTKSASKLDCTKTRKARTPLTDDMPDPTLYLCKKYRQTRKRSCFYFSSRFIFIIQWHRTHPSCSCVRNCSKHRSWTCAVMAWGQRQRFGMLPLVQQRDSSAVRTSCAKSESSALRRTSSISVWR
jgi:hypothetical protein